MNPADLFRLETDTTNLSPGEWVFRQGDVGDAMYVLLEGNVDVIVGETVVETAERGALLGEMALIDNSPRCANAVPARRPQSQALHLHGAADAELLDPRHEGDGRTAAPDGWTARE
jgi:CRP-like cAMP-binding protein